MDEREYEQRKQELDLQLEAGIEILRTAHRTQRHALDLVWHASPENRTAGVLPFDSPLAPAPPSRPASPPPAAPPPKRRWRPGELRDAIEDALEKVPVEFDRSDLIGALGVEPERGSLYRVVEELREEGVLALAGRGRGQAASRYRKLQ